MGQGGRDGGGQALKPDRFTFAPSVFVDGCWELARRAQATEPRDVRVLTWNVWFGYHLFEERREALLAELGRRRADVIALQEVTPELLGDLLDEPWVRHEYSITEREVIGYDVIVLSRLPVVRAAVVPVPTEMGRRLVVVELACGLAVATIHLESTREEAPARATQLGIVQPALAARYPDSVLVGDMNFAPGDAREEAASDPAFVDVWPALRPDEPGYTVDGERNTMRGDVCGKPDRRRIDRVFARTVRWTPVAIELVGTQPITGDGSFISDHFGLEAVFSAGTTAPRSRSGTAS